MDLESLLALAAKSAEQAEVFFVSSKETPVGFEANRLKHLQTKESTGVGLRIVKNGRTGISATNRLQDHKQLVAQAVEMSQFGAAAMFELPSVTAYAKLDTYDPAVEAVAIDDMVQMGQQLIDKVRSVNQDLLCEATVTKRTSSVRILNSKGCSVSYQKSVFALGIEGTLIRGTDMLFVGDSDSSCRPIKETAHVSKAVIEQLELAKDTVPAPNGKVPVVFTPHAVAGGLLFPLTVAFNGKTVLQGASPLVGRLGQEVLDKRFTLWDDPLVPYKPGSRICDDEGVPSRRNALVDHGVAATFLYDLQTAGLAKAKSTGSAARSVGGLPSPSSSVLVIEAGDVSYKQMLADINEGLVVEQLLGAGQGNVLGGDFGGNVLLGYKIERGRIIGRVKDTMVSGNVYESMKRLRALGSERRWIGGSLHTPAIACDDVSVSRKG